MTAEQFQIFPHGLVYTGVIFMLGWVALVVSLALRGISRLTDHGRSVHKVDGRRYSSASLLRIAQPVESDADEARVGGVDR